MSRREFFTCEEAASYIENCDDFVNDLELVVIPPKVDTLTDEDEGPGDISEFEHILVNDIAGTVEVHTELSGDAFEQDTDYENEYNLHEFNWKKGRVQYSRQPSKNVETDCVKTLSEKLGPLSPVEFFELFYDQEMRQFLHDHFHLYARQNNRTLTMNMNELDAFIGFLLFSGYHNLPRVRMYFSEDDDVACPLVKKALSRSKLESIMKNAHFADNNNLAKNDRFAKVRPLIDLVNCKFIQFGIFHHSLSIDEQMVGYYGKHSCKMFIYGKPTKFGFKNWVLAGSTGYVYCFDPYQGKKTGVCHKNLGLGGSVVMNLLKKVENPQNHEIYFDNFFSSIPLMMKLAEKGYFAAGTVRTNRLNSVKCLSSLDKFKKVSRGKFEYGFENDHQLLLVRWKDSSVVNMITNFGTVEPQLSVRRYNRQQKKHVMVEQPNVFQKYNQGMGGVDLTDSMIASYRVGVKGKKWYWNYFTNILDQIVVNSYRLYNDVSKANGNKPIALLDFRRMIATTFLKRNANENANNPGTPSAFRLSVRNNALLNGTHLVARYSDNKRRRCRGCAGQSLYFCETCKETLHPECFVSFHVRS